MGEDLQVPAVDRSFMVDALCLQTDPEAFFPEKGGSNREAKGICGRCEVRTECREYALAIWPVKGVWGGHSERELQRMFTDRTRSIA